jgi:uncharacterized damage-inducible protein DinB
MGQAHLLVARPPMRWFGRSDETDGYQRWAPVGFRLAASLNHGADHRSQICTALTTLGVDPPGIDVYNFGLDAGRVVEKMPA